MRWYSDLDGTRRRTGVRRSQASRRQPALESARARFPLLPSEIAGWDLQDPRLLAFPLLLREHGVLRQASWQPMMLIRYRRDRFIEPLSGSRVSLDSDISGVAVNPTFLSAPTSRRRRPRCSRSKGAATNCPPAASASGAGHAQALVLEISGRLRAHDARACLLESSRHRMQQQLNNLFGAITQGSGPQVTRSRS